MLCVDCLFINPEWNFELCTPLYWILSVEIYGGFGSKGVPSKRIPCSHLHVSENTSPEEAWEFLVQTRVVTCLKMSGCQKILHPHLSLITSLDHRAHSKVSLRYLSVGWGLLVPLPEQFISICHTRKVLVSLSFLKFNFSPFKGIRNCLLFLTCGLLKPWQWANKTLAVNTGQIPTLVFPQFEG